MCFYFVIYNFSDSSYAKSKKVIYIYADDGASKESISQTFYNLKQLKLHKKYDIKFIYAKEILKNQWSENAKLLIMPGGASLPYSKKLNGIGNQNIINFVRNGGSFLGICAGAYYGCEYVEFAKNSDLEILCHKELKFFPSKAIGPALAKYDYKSNSGARAALLKIFVKNKIQSSYFYSNGGGYFDTTNLNKNQINKSDLKSMKIIAEYCEIKKPAIIFSKFGNGKVILSMVHFEYNPYNIKNDEFLEKILPTLKTYDKQRIKFSKIIFKKLAV